MAHHPPATGNFPPQVLREYALLADGERGALVGPRGDIGWLCAPRWDSDPVFSSLIGGHGVYAVTPDASHFVWGGYYDEGSLIWNSRWVSTTGIIECREALAFPAEAHQLVLLRRIRAIAGPAVVQVVLAPQAGYDRRGLHDLRRTTETRTGTRGGYLTRAKGDVTVWTARIGDLHLRFSGSEQATATAEGLLRATIRVPDGGFHDLVLEIGTQPFSSPVIDAGEAWQTSEHTWRSGIPDLAGGVAQTDAVHAHAVLRGLTSASGGMVAAATTSLPERAQAGRNYDYRYAWIRDQCFAGQAAAVAGDNSLLDTAVHFVSARLRSDGARLAPAYTVTGDRIPPEKPLPFLPGYPGARPSTGNRVTHQFQLDTFGEALLLLAAAGQRERLGTDHWRALEVATAAINERWHEPDAGIWELDNQHWTHSKLICVAGLRAAAKIATPAQSAAWSALADTILANTSAHALHPSGRWQRTPDDGRVDTALLLPALRGALPSDDPRSVATLRAVIDELQCDGYVYRFRPDPRPLGAAEGAFLLCGFVTALSVHQIGDTVTAARWFERNRAACGPPRLYSEEYDITQGQLRGNLPQAFVHALLLQGAVTLSAEGQGGSAGRYGTSTA